MRDSCRPSAAGCLELVSPGPGQTDFGRIDSSTVKDALGSVHWDIDHRPVSMQLLMRCLRASFRTHEIGGTRLAAHDLGADREGGLWRSLAGLTCQFQVLSLCSGQHFSRLSDDDSGDATDPSGDHRRRPSRLAPVPYSSPQWRRQHCPRTTEPSPCAGADSCRRAGGWRHRAIARSRTG